MTKYDESNIERYAGLSGIRKKSAPYIGPNNSDGLWTIFREPADNGVDLALKGINKFVHLIFDPEPNKYWVLDEGPGFPVGFKTFQDERGRNEKLSTFYVTTGLTHGGSNFNSTEISRGTHGIGIKATNAMSKVFKVFTFREGSWYSISYKDAKLIQDVTKCKAPKLPHGLVVKKGSVVYFEPDLSLFTKDSKMVLDDVTEWCKLTSYLVPNIEVQLTVRSGKSKIYKTKGLQDYIDIIIADLKCTQTGKTFVHHDKGIDVALAFTSAETTELAAYTNGLRNVEGGEHVDSVYSALVASLKPYKGKLKYNPSDLRDGIVGLVNCKISAPQFNNQRKDKLIDPRTEELCYKTTLTALLEFWKKNKTMAIAISRRAAELRKKTADFLSDKQMIKNVKKAGMRMSTKLSDVSSNKTPIEDRELFLVEGDSAGGTAKKARFKEFQATFKLRGKPLNVMDAAKEKVNANAEVAGILAAIGLGQNNKDVNNIRYGKIVFLADPDIDGKHINCLLLALFWKYLPSLFKDGKIYMLKAPEYYTEHKKKIITGSSPEEVTKKAGVKVDVRHIKGWGELDAYKMTPMAFDKKTRELIQILPPKTKEEEEEFRALMGSDSTYRKKMLGVSE